MVIPAAMPSEPMASRTGIFAGKAIGSRLRPSYESSNSVVSGLNRTSLARGVRRHSIYRAADGLVSCEDVSEVPLSVDEQLLVGQVHQCAENGQVAMGMVPHGLAHDIGDLVILSVVHLMEGRAECAAETGLKPSSILGIARFFME